MPERSQNHIDRRDNRSGPAGGILQHNLLPSPGNSIPIFEEFTSKNGKGKATIYTSAK